MAPWPGALTTVTVPSAILARSIAERSPKCSLASLCDSAWSGEKPTPSSATVASRWPSAVASRMCTCVQWACLWTLITASRTMR